MYHGWKFDTAGRCLEVPNAPVRQAFRDWVAVKFYPVIEKGGMCWAYLGPRELPPELPHYPFLDVPESHYCVGKFFVEGNYFQPMEGEADSGHVGFLHRFVNAAGNSAASTGGKDYVNQVPHVHWEVDDTDYGLGDAYRHRARVART